MSNDEGNTFEHGYVLDIPEPIEGCEGSTVAHPETGNLYYSGPVGSGYVINLLRVNMTIWKSEDGLNYKSWKVVDPGAVSYSAMCFSTDFKKLGILWENSDTVRLVF